MGGADVRVSSDRSVGDSEVNVPLCRPGPRFRAAHLLHDTPSLPRFPETHHAIYAATRPNPLTQAQQPWLQKRVKTTFKTTVCPLRNTKLQSPARNAH